MIPRNPIRAYLLVVHWDLMSILPLLPFLIVVQFLMGGGMVMGLGYLFDDISRQQALYLATGGSVIALLMVGLVAAPQIIAQHKTAKTYDFMLFLPIPRITLAFSSITVWTLVSIPGMSLALTVASYWYGLDLNVSIFIIPDALLTVLVATSVGLAFAHALAHPGATILVTQVLAFGILLFSPINYPAERLPMWLQRLHQFLPFQHAAVVVRGALTEGWHAGMRVSFAVLLAWTVVSWAITLWFLNRRR